MSFARRKSPGLMLVMIMLLALLLGACGDDEESSSEDTAPSTSPANTNDVGDSGADVDAGDTPSGTNADTSTSVDADLSPRAPASICANADTSEPETRDYDDAEQVLEDGVDYWAVMCTDAGPIVIDLFEDDAPITVNNFVFLAREGYYNNTTFHRVLAGFMAQAGDPTGTGSGGPGYQFEDETDNGLTFDEIGLLAMANAGANTNGSQFFITYALTDWLNGNHTIFGRVTSGMANAELLKLRDPQQGPTFPGAALNTVVILEGADAVSAEPDSAPSLEHIQAVMVQNIAVPITLFTQDEERSGVRDLDAEAAAWSAGGDDLVDTMRASLSDSGYLGSAGVWLTLGDCAANAADGPVWEIGLRVMDFGANGSEGVVFDEARTQAILDAGVFTSTTDLQDELGRIFEGGSGLPLCGDNAVQYRLELPYDRYLLVVTLTVDGTIVTADSEAPPDQYVIFVTQEFLLGRISGVLDRGNMVLMAE